jgi:hypothetical protein
MPADFAASFAHQARGYVHYTPGADIRKLCAQNAVVADECGAAAAAQSWRVLALLFSRLATGAFDEAEPSDEPPASLPRNSGTARHARPTMQTSLKCLRERHCIHNSILKDSCWY